MSAFHVGDRVRLKGTTGPTMLVSGRVHNPAKYPKGTKIVCEWHDHQGKPHQRAYRAELLEHVQPVLAPSPSENSIG